MVILAIDQGTSGTKALVHDGERVLAVVERPIRPRYLESNGVEIDPYQLLDSVVAAGRAALEAAGNPPLTLVTIANQGESVLAWIGATVPPVACGALAGPPRAGDLRRATHVSRHDSRPNRPRA